MSTTPSSTPPPVSVTPTPAPAPAVAPSAAQSLEQDIVNLVSALESPTSGVSTIANLLGDLVGVGAVGVGATQAPIGLHLAAVPQTLLIAGGAILLAGTQIVRQWIKSKTKSTAVTAALALRHGVVVQAKDPTI